MPSATSLAIEVQFNVTEHRVTTPRQLRKILALYAEQARADEKLWMLRLIASSGDVLHIVVGGDESYLWLEPADNPGDGWISRGSLREPNDVLTYYAEYVHHTQCPGDWVVSMQAAEQAAVEFLLTQSRPDSLHWHIA